MARKVTLFTVLCVVATATSHTPTLNTASKTVQRFPAQLPGFGNLASQLGIDLPKAPQLPADGKCQILPNGKFCYSSSTTSNVNGGAFSFSGGITYGFNGDHLISSSKVHI